MVTIRTSFSHCVNSAIQGYREETMKEPASPADALTEEVKRTFLKYMDTYFVERNLELTLSMFSPALMGFGTGIDEKGYDYEDFSRLYTRDIEQAPEKINYDVTSLVISIPAPNVGIVNCECNIKTVIQNNEVKLNNLRLSMTLVKNNTGWLIELMHISFPTEAHEEKEAYPIKELEDRNRVLERMVDEKTKKLQEMLHVKEILIREIDHRVKNNLSLIASLISLEEKRVTEEKSRNILNDIKSRINSIGLIHDKLYKSQDLVSIEIKPFMKTLVAMLVESLTKGKNTPEINLEIDDILVNSKTAVPLGLIVTELVTNSIKYAAAGKKLELTIMLKSEPDCLDIMISDNGYGIENYDSKDFSQSMGMQLVTLLVDQLNGNLKYMPQNGAAYNIQIGQCQ